MEILAIIGLLLIPALIIFLAFKGGKILFDLQKEVKKISEELRKKDF